jgi:histidinol phosphatase-like enzyme
MADWTPTAAIDFDGTIVEHAWPNIGKLKPGAKTAVARLKDAGFHILIFTCRANPPDGGKFDDPDATKLKDMVRFLKEHDIPFDDVWTGAGKPFATAYVDDKAIRYGPTAGGLDWPEIAEFLIQSRHAAVA